MKTETIKIILDRAEEFESRGRKITLGEVLDFYADAEESKEGSPLVNEEGEVDLSALVAKLVGGKYWRDKALSDDHARKAAGALPSKIYRARLDVNPENKGAVAAQARIETAREEAAKEAGIVLPTAPVKAPKAAPVQPLEDALAATLAAPVKAPKAAKPPKAPKAAKEEPKSYPMTPAGLAQATADAQSKAAPKAIEAAKASAPALPKAAPSFVSPERMAELRAKHAAKLAAKHAAK